MYHERGMYINVNEHKKIVLKEMLKQKTAKPWRVPQDISGAGFISLRGKRNFVLQERCLQHIPDQFLRKRKEWPFIFI